MAPYGFWVFIVGAGAYVIAAGYTDLRLQRIPNYLTFAAAIGGLVFSLLKHFQVLSEYPTDISDCLLGFGLGFGLFFIPFAFGGGGSGDVKLAAGLGALLGLYNLLFALALSLGFAMIAAFVLWTTSFSAGAAKTRRQRPSVSIVPEGLSKPRARRRPAVPFAIPLALGTWCVLGWLAFQKLHPELLIPSNPPVAVPPQAHS